MLRCQYSSTMTVLAPMVCSRGTTTLLNSLTVCFYGYWQGWSSLEKIKRKGFPAPIISLPSFCIWKWLRRLFTRVYICPPSYMDTKQEVVTWIFNSVKAKPLYVGTFANIISSSKQTQQFYLNTELAKYARGECVLECYSGCFEPRGIQWLLTQSSTITYVYFTHPTGIL